MAQKSPGSAYLGHDDPLPYFHEYGSEVYYCIPILAMLGCRNHGDYRLSHNYPGGRDNFVVMYGDQWMIATWLVAEGVSQYGLDASTTWV